jgi:NAD(P)-dependent dehydrogenase (short-subunit alcohol dehydrogenase family)
VRALVDEVVATWGRIDCAANRAGVGGGHAMTHDYPVEEWDRIVSVNLRGTWLALRAEIEAMLAAEAAGAIVNVASTLALRGSPFGSPYSRERSSAKSSTPCALTTGLTRRSPAERLSRR